MKVEEREVGSQERRSKSREPRAKSRRGLYPKPYALRSMIYALRPKPYLLPFLTVLAAFALGASVLSIPSAIAVEENASSVPEEPARLISESRHYLIEGVHYLMNEGDRDTAEDLFRKAIFTSPFGSLSREGNGGQLSEASVLSDRWVVAEAFYFLGRIYYERAVSQVGVVRDADTDSTTPKLLVLARKYLRKAEQYGIIYDRLHPSLLDEISRRFPEIEVPIEAYDGSGQDKAKVMIEFDHGSYQMDAVKVDLDADVTESSFSTSKEFDLECGARYKVKPDVQGGYKVMYRALALLGIGVVFWLTRG
jgi:hypothetical protein